MNNETFVPSMQHMGFLTMNRLWVLKLQNMIFRSIANVAIHTENRILNYDYKAGFEPHTEYAKIQRETERERRIMNILR